MPGSSSGLGKKLRDHRKRQVGIGDDHRGTGASVRIIRAEQHGRRTGAGKMAAIGRTREVRNLALAGPVDGRDAPNGNVAVAANDHLTADLLPQGLGDVGDRGQGPHDQRFSLSFSVTLAVMSCLGLT